MKYEYSYYPGGLLREKRASGRTLMSYTYDLDGRKISQRDLTGKRQDMPITGTACFHR